MQMPKIGTDRYAVLNAIRENGGSMTNKEIADKLADDNRSRQKVHSATNSLLTTGHIYRVDHTYFLDPSAIHEFNKTGEEECDEYVGEIVSPRTATPFKPMKSVPWAHHLDRLRADFSVKAVTGNLHSAGYRA